MIAQMIGYDHLGERKNVLPFYRGSHGMPIVFAAIVPMHLLNTFFGIK